jgi:hypothetical protein
LTRFEFAGEMRYVSRVGGGGDICFLNTFDLFDRGEGVVRGTEVVAGRYKNFRYLKSGTSISFTYQQLLQHNFEEVVVKDGWS